MDNQRCRCLWNARDSSRINDSIGLVKLTVQFQNIESNNISEFKRPNTQAVVYPPETASASLIYPYAKARR